MTPSMHLTISNLQLWQSKSFRQQTQHAYQHDPTEICHMRHQIIISRTEKNRPVVFCT